MADTILIIIRVRKVSVVFFAILVHGYPVADASHSEVDDSLQFPVVEKVMERPPIDSHNERNSLLDIEFAISINRRKGNKKERERAYRVPPPSSSLGSESVSGLKE